MEQMLRILVLDADQRASLAVVRSLGRRGLEVTVADSKATTLAGASRFACASLVHPPIQENQDRFLEWLDDIIPAGRFDALVPVTEVTTDLVVRNRERWPQVIVPFAPIALIDRLSSKVSLYELALEVGVPVPRSIVITDDESLERAKQKIGFPCILKPDRSRVLIGGRWCGTSVRRADNDEELARLLNDDPGLQLRPLLYQEYIPGKGAGIFALYEGGEPRVWFAHHRLREKPPGGGVSVLSESVAPSAAMLEAGRKLLDAVRWEGVAMVEFRVAPDGTAYLMEINARFWGSLQLAVDAGADFPVELLAPWLGGRGDDRAKPQVGVRLQWVLGDLDRLWLVWKGRRSQGWAALPKALWGFGQSLVSPSTRSETWRWSDLGPGWVELRRYLLRAD